jgi:hypothetical protein
VTAVVATLDDTVTGIALVDEEVVVVGRIGILAAGGKTVALVVVRVTAGIVEATVVIIGRVVAAVTVVLVAVLVVAAEVIVLVAAVVG